MSRETLLWWSGGKDSAWSLQRLREDTDRDVVALLNTIDPATGRVPYQGATRAAVAAQAEAIGIELWQVDLAFPASDLEYTRVFGEIAARARSRGVETMAFGDLFLEDIRSFREQLVTAEGLKAHFPLWGSKTNALAREMLDSELEAIVSCVDPARVSREWMGEPFDREFLAALGPSVDPCGEHGEFHTFVVDGPMFSQPIEVSPLNVIARGSFVELGLDAGPVSELLIDGVLDLHAFAPREVKALVTDYLDECRRRDILEVRIIHGKGIGALRETVHAVLRRRADVVDFQLGGDAAGGWGATTVTLRPGREDTE